MGPRILLVEDDPGLRLTLTHRLGSEGYRVETAGDGEEGLALAVGDAFDLVILDVMLPRKSGFLTPSFGRSSLFGEFFGLGYYWAIRGIFNNVTGP